MGICGQSIIVPSSSSQLASTWLLPRTCSPQPTASVWVLSTRYSLSGTDGTVEGSPTGFLPSWTVKNGSLSLIAVFRNFFSVGSLHGLPSFRTILFCHGSFIGCRSSGKFLLYEFLSVDNAPARSLLHCGISTACIFLQHISTCCGTGSSMGWTVVVYSNGDLSELQGDSLCIHDLHHGVQGNLCSCICRSSSPPSHLTSAGLFQWNFSYSSLTVPAQNFVLFKYASPEVTTMLSQGLIWILRWLCWSGWNLLFLSQDSANLLPQKPSLLPSVPNTWTPPPNIIQMVTDTVQNPAISAPLLSCLSNSSPTSGSLPVFAQKMKEDQQLIHTNSVFPKSIWKLACRNSRLGWQFGIYKLLLALNRTGISLGYLSLLYCRVCKATVTHTVEFVAIQKH